jgi:hypothetical protein
MTKLKNDTIDANVLVHSKAGLSQIVSTRLVRFDNPNAKFHGKTQNFNVYVDPNVGNVNTIADGVLQSCESEYTFLKGVFGGITPTGIPFNIIIEDLTGNHDGSGGAYHATCAAVDMYVDVKTTPQVDVDMTRLFVVAEEVEVFSDSQGKGWDCGASNGEGLSRILATESYPKELDGYTTAAVWLDTDRTQDWVNNNDPTDRNNVSTGCSVLFLNWLHYQKGFRWDTIVGAGAPTLGQTYSNITGDSSINGFSAFKADLQRKYPVGAPSGLTTDNPFPINGGGKGGR